MLAKSVSLTRLKYIEKCIIKVCRAITGGLEDSQFEDKVIVTSGRRIQSPIDFFILHYRVSILCGSSQQIAAADAKIQQQVIDLAKFRSLSLFPNPFP